MQGGEGAGGEDDQVSEDSGRQWVNRGSHHWPSKGVQTVLMALSIKRCSSLEESGALKTCGLLNRGLKLIGRSWPDSKTTFNTFFGPHISSCKDLSILNGSIGCSCLKGKGLPDLRKAFFGVPFK